MDLGVFAVQYLLFLDKPRGYVVKLWQTQGNMTEGSLIRRNRFLLRKAVWAEAQFVYNNPTILAVPATWRHIFGDQERAEIRGGVQSSVPPFVRWWAFYAETEVVQILIGFIWLLVWIICASFLLSQVPADYTPLPQQPKKWTRARGDVWNRLYTLPDSTSHTELALYPWSYSVESFHLLIWLLWASAKAQHRLCDLHRSVPRLLHWGDCTVPGTMCQGLEIRPLRELARISGPLASYISMRQGLMHGTTGPWDYGTMGLWTAKLLHAGQLELGQRYLHWRLWRCLKHWALYSASCMAPARFLQPFKPGKSHPHHEAAVLALLTTSLCFWRQVCRSDLDQDVDDWVTHFGWTAASRFLWRKHHKVSVETAELEEVAA